MENALYNNLKCAKLQNFVTLREVHSGDTKRSEVVFEFLMIQFSHVNSNPVKLNTIFENFYAIKHNIPFYIENKVLWFVSWFYSQCQSCYICIWNDINRKAYSYKCFKPQGNLLTIPKMYVTLEIFGESDNFLWPTNRKEKS